MAMAQWRREMSIGRTMRVRRASLLVVRFCSPRARRPAPSARGCRGLTSGSTRALDRAASVVEAAATLPDCLAAMERTAETFKKAMRSDAEVSRDPRHPLTLMVMRKGHSATLRCLPGSRPALLLALD